MKYKMIASDLDGTLNNNEYIISEGNALAIKRAVSKGLKVVLCSGRSPVSINSYAKDIGLNTEGCYGIGFNGGSIYETSTGKSLYKAHINKELAIKIIRDIKKVCSHVKIAIYIEDDHIIAEKDLDILEEHNNQGIMKIEKVNSFEGITKDIIKIMLVDDRDKLDYIFSKMKNIVAGNYNMVFTGAQILEFLPLNVNKAEGLKILAKYLGISLEEIVAFGDNYNDIEMVKEVGFGIAIANAVQPLKEVANYVTKRDNNNDAMIEVVDMILNNSTEEYL